MLLVKKYEQCKSHTLSFSLSASHSFFPSLSLSSLDWHMPVIVGTHQVRVSGTPNGGVELTCIVPTRENLGGRLP